MLLVYLLLSDWKVYFVYLCTAGCLFAARQGEAGEEMNTVMVVCVCLVDSCRPP